VNSAADAPGGLGGSGGGDATQGTPGTNFYSTADRSTPGNYGGGAAGSELASTEHADGAGGAVRIIWGSYRAFPSTNTGDVL
jgi:hypothetical protein